MNSVIAGYAGHSNYSNVTEVSSVVHMKGRIYLPGAYESNITIEGCYLKIFSLMNPDTDEMCTIARRVVATQYLFLNDLDNNSKPIGSIEEKSVFMEDFFAGKKELVDHWDKQAFKQLAVCSKSRNVVEPPSMNNQLTWKVFLLRQTRIYQKMKNFQVPVIDQLLLEELLVPEIKKKIFDIRFQKRENAGVENGFSHNLAKFNLKKYTGPEIFLENSDQVVLLLSVMSETLGQRCFKKPRSINLGNFLNSDFFSSMDTCFGRFLPYGHLNATGHLVEHVGGFGQINGDQQPSDLLETERGYKPAGDLLQGESASLKYMDFDDSDYWGEEKCINSVMKCLRCGINMDCGFFKPKCLGKYKLPTLQEQKFDNSLVSTDIRTISPWLSDDQAFPLIPRASDELWHELPYIDGRELPKGDCVCCTTLEAAQKESDVKRKKSRGTGQNHKMDLITGIHEMHETSGTGTLVMNVEEGPSIKASAIPFLVNQGTTYNSEEDICVHCGQTIDLNHACQLWNDLHQNGDSENLSETQRAFVEENDVPPITTPMSPEADSYYELYGEEVENNNSGAEPFIDEPVQQLDMCILCHGYVDGVHQCSANQNRASVTYQAESDAEIND